MANPNAFGMRMREIRRLKEISVQDLAASLRMGAWKDLDPGAARARVNNLELGRLVNVSRAECNEIERILGAEPDELWEHLMLDSRKVDPEVLSYFNDIVDRLEDVIDHTGKSALEMAEQTGGTFVSISFGDLADSNGIKLLELVGKLEEEQPGFTTDLYHALRSMLREEHDEDDSLWRVDGVVGMAHLLRGLRELEPAQAQAWVLMRAVELLNPGPAIEAYVGAAQTNMVVLRGFTAGREVARAQAAVRDAQQPEIRPDVARVLERLLRMSTISKSEKESIRALLERAAGPDTAEEAGSDDPGDSLPYDDRDVPF